MQRLDPQDARAAKRRVEDFLEEAQLIGVTDEITRRAGDLAEQHRCSRTTR